MRGQPPFQFDFPQIPEEEHALARSIYDALRAMADYTDQFQSALSLFEHTTADIHMRMRSGNPDGVTTFVGWAYVAARDGAMTMYHFMRAMEGAKACIHRSPTVKAYQDLTKSRSATKLFSSRFPKCEAMRHSIAHTAELVESPEKRRANAISGDYDDGVFEMEGVTEAVISNVLSGSTYTNTINGQLISYDISQATLDGLIEVRDIFYSSFMG